MKSAWLARSMGSYVLNPPPILSRSERMKLKFGTSGLRGLATELLEGPAAVFTRAFVTHLVAQGHARLGDPVFVGRDLRESSPAILDMCLQALADAGMQPVDCGQLPTPALALHAGTRRGGAIMITGSHIPADRNGLKFYLPDGEIDKEDEQRIWFYASEEHRHETANGHAPCSVIREGDAAWTLYRQRYSGIMSPDTLSRLRIGIYQHSSVARDFLGHLLMDHGAEIITLSPSETFIPVDTEALSHETQALLKDAAACHELDAIVSTDADGDRPLLTDETGSQIRGDILGLITARVLKAKWVVTPATSNSAIDLDPAFRTIRTQVGSPHVIKGMRNAPMEEGVVVGFEANGGFLLGTPAHFSDKRLEPLITRDATLPMLAVLQQRAAADRPLSQIVAAMALPICMSDRLEDFPIEDSSALMKWLLQQRTNIDQFLDGIGHVERIEELDGLRVILAKGEVVHLRPSGNAPEMRCYVEAATPERASWLLHSCLKRVADRRTFKASTLGN